MKLEKLNRDLQSFKETYWISWLVKNYNSKFLFKQNKLYFYKR